MTHHSSLRTAQQERSHCNMDGIKVGEERRREEVTRSHYTGMMAQCKKRGRRRIRENRTMMK